MSINISLAQNNNDNGREGNHSHPSIYASLGIGGNYFGVTYGAEVSYTQNNNIFSIRYVSANELRFNVDGVYDEPDLSMNEIGLLYGRYMSKGNGQISLAAGLGLLNGIDRGYQIDYHVFNKLEIQTVGLCFEGRFFLIFTDYSGIGVVIFGNLNPRKTYLGAMFEVHLGFFPD